MRTASQITKQDAAVPQSPCLWSLLAKPEETAALARVPVTSFACSRTSADGIIQCVWQQQIVLFHCLQFYMDGPHYSTVM